MINQDVFRFLLRNVSSKEFDALIYLINKRDWNSNVRIDFYDLSKKINTTTRYARDIIRKFTSQRRGNILQLINNESFIYKLNLGNSSLFYYQGEKYSKVFNFFTESTFQEFSIYSKRLILSSAFDISSTGHSEAYLRVSDFLYSDEISSGLIPNRKSLLNSIKEINEKTKVLGITLSLVSSLITKEELLKVTFPEDIHNQVIFNFTERENLTKDLFIYGYCDILPVEHSIEIEKVMKYVFNSFKNSSITYQKGKQLYIDGVDAGLNLAREIINKSLAKLAPSIKKNRLDSKEPEEISAYFSSICFSTALEELNRFNYQISSSEKILQLVGETPFYSEVFEINNICFFVLENFCEGWILSRTNKGPFELGREVKESKKRLTSLRGFLEKVAKSFEDKVSLKNKYYLTDDHTYRFWENFKESALNLIDKKINTTKNITVTDLF